MDQNNNSASTCANCSSALTGRFCASCGQDSHASFKLSHFLEQLIEGLTHFDSTVWRTFLPLLFKPGLVTEGYLSGRRKSYAPPIRTYLVLSIVYFLIASWVSSMNTNVVDLNNQSITPENCHVMAGRMHWLGKLVSDPEAVCLRALRDNGRALGQTVDGLMPKIMFVVLPLVALIHHWMYRRQRRFYVENLIFILHFQSFYFLAGTAFLLLASAIAAMFGATHRSVTAWLDPVLYLWSGVYLFVAIRRVYRVGKFKTTLSIAVLILAYLILWALGVSIAGLYAFLHA